MAGSEEQEREPEAPEEVPASGSSGLRQGVEAALALSRLLAIIPVVVLVVAALGAFVYGTVEFIHGVQGVATQPFPVGNRIGLFLLVIDLFLVGATLLIAGIGFYELFIGRIRPRGFVRLPSWLEMHDLNDLKARVIAMIVLVAAVSFIEPLVDSNSSVQVLEYGGAVAVVIVALTVFLRFGGHGGER